jgi:hypothetical protein
VIGPVRHCVPGSLRGVRLIGMDLRIDDRHWGSSSVPSELVSQQVRIQKSQASCLAGSMSKNFAEAADYAEGPGRLPERDG